MTEPTDPDKPPAFLERYKAATPGETLLKMLSAPTLSLRVTESRSRWCDISIEVSCAEWNVDQFLDALKRHQLEHVEVGIASAYEEAIEHERRHQEHLESLRRRLPQYVVDKLHEKHGFR